MTKRTWKRSHYGFENNPPVKGEHSPSARGSDRYVGIWPTETEKYGSYDVALVRFADRPFGGGIEAIRQRSGVSRKKANRLYDEYKKAK